MAKDASPLVDLALVLAVDVSSSVDGGDYKLQMDGIAAALRHPPLLQAIRQGEHRAIALTLVHWSRRDSQVIVLPWRILAKTADMEDAAHRVESAERQWKPGGTGLAVAITYCAALALSAPVRATRQVVDVSGDGEDNDGGDVRLARDEAVAAGVTINGLPILTGSHTLLSYYSRRVVGGEDSFVVPAIDIRAFRDAMKEKLLREVGAQTV
jgi:hypothetical protein